MFSTVSIVTSTFGDQVIRVWLPTEAKNLLLSTAPRLILVPTHLSSG